MEEVNEIRYVERKEHLMVEGSLMRITGITIADWLYDVGVWKMLVM